MRRKIETMSKPTVEVPEQEPTSPQRKPKTSANTVQPVGERVAKLEAKLETPQTEEERYHARKAKYLANVEKRKAKDARRAELERKLEDES